MTEIEMSVGKYMFDLELHDVDSTLSRLLLAPRRIPGKMHGCVVLEWNPNGDSSDGSVHIASIVYDAQCSENCPLEKKYGTRAMVIGSLQAMMTLARDRWPFLNSFCLQDSSTFQCPPLERVVHTFAVDLLVGDETYYERHLRVVPEKELVQEAKKRVLRRVHGKIPSDLQYNVFFKKMLDLIDANELILDSDAGKEKKLFLNEIYNDVRVSFESAVTWRDFFIRVQKDYGCSFFAASGPSLIDMFEMGPLLLGAAWTVYSPKSVLGQPKNLD